ncbi:TIGR02757 family protein [Rhodohalobacter halophilus]|uniref:TIGR02757 family protein n=1 Tax=Rhodohalobacter halophilus TaxID=1812810 RepID=UPI000A079487|nr:TIGR02757 family protein [Rhodohalobacter halophilus]
MNDKPKLRGRSIKSLMELKPLLDRMNDEVEEPGYIPHDPVQFMHLFTDKRDMEIAGFLAATMAWGRRDIVISKVHDLLKRMHYQPFEFVMGYSQKQFDRLTGFKHRTFKPIDIHGMVLALQQIYLEYEDFEEFWAECHRAGLQQDRPFLALFHERFFEKSSDLAERTRKHISNPEKGSTCKRLYMYLRWTIRKDSPVDPGIWNFIEPSELLVPFDVHVARQARRYGLITRRSDDWKTVNELTESLKIMNPDDPARYDYALFGIGALDYNLPKKFILNKV